MSARSDVWDALSRQRAMMRARRAPERYRRALSAYLRDPEHEQALLAGYDHGRRELGRGRSLLEVLSEHNQALLESELGEALDPRAKELFARAHDFLVQSVVPFEGARRGFADLNQTLQALNQTLEQRVAERTAELARRVEQLQALGDISRVITSNLDLDDVLTAIVARAVQLSGTGSGAIFQYESGGQLLVLRAAHPIAPGSLADWEAHARLPLNGASFVAVVARSGQPVQLPDLEAIDYAQVQGSAAASDAIARNSLGPDNAVRAMLILPLLLRNELVGVLCVCRATPGEFSAETVELMQMFAAQSTVAIRNAQLFRNLQQNTLALEVVSRRKSQFLANMSHELRTPLNAIIGFAEIMLDHTIEALPEEKRAVFLGHIQRSGKHLLGLINDVLDLSKIEAGRMELNLQPTSVREAIEECAAAMRVVADAKQIDLSVCVAPASAIVCVDPARFKQVVYNLLSNAVKFTPDGGRVRVEARMTRREIVVEVQDTGVGISPHDQVMLFQEFSQVGSVAADAQGTGLGLALVRKIVELHSGRVWVDSNPGEGSCFAFSLPLEQNA